MGRKLRLVLIDDHPATELETGHLQLQRVPYGPEEEDPSLGCWVQHLRLWSENLFPEQDPDLVLIDCRFDNDHTHVPMSASLQGSDPRGLLHGAVFISRMFGRDRFHPFGFAVYSMDASGFRDDAYAQTFMGFLLAMRDSTLGEGQQGAIRGRRAREMVGSCADELGRTVSQNPATAWGPALAMYRARLREVLDLQACVLARDSWLRAVEAVAGGDLEALDGGLALTWRRFGGTKDEVELRSLFADCLEGDRWGPRALAEAGAWLDSLLVIGDHLDDALDWASQVLLHEREPESLEVPRGKDLHGQNLTRFFHACTGVLAWYENRRRGTATLPSTSLALEIGLSDTQLNRYFRPLVSLPWGRVVDLLDEGLERGAWPFPNLWELRQVVRDWAVHVRSETFPFRSAP